MGRALIDDVKMSDRILERLRAMQQPYWLPVRGRSMYPLLREGDSVQVHPHGGAEPNRLVRGWLILLEHEGIPVVHRYLGEIGGVHYEAGDHAGKLTPFELDDCIGLVVARKRDGRIHSLKPSLFWRLLHPFPARSPR